VGELGDTPFAVVPLPDIRPGVPARPFVTVESVFLTSQPTGERADLAVDFMAYLAGPEASVVRATVGRQVVAHPRAYDDPDVGGDALLATFAEAAQRGIPMPNRAEMQAIWEPGNHILERTLRGAVSVEEAMAEAQVELDRSLEPPPPPRSGTPYLIGFGLLLLLAAVWAVRRIRRGGVIAQMKRNGIAYAYIMPAAVGCVLLIFLPFFIGAGMSLYAYEHGEFSFVGFANFGSILSTTDYALTHPKSFFFTLVVTVLWTVLNVALHVSVGLGLALLLRDPWVRMRGIYRVLLIIPWAVPNYITALVWRSMFDFNFGAINGILNSLGVDSVDWFANWATSFAANVTTNAWLGFPFMMVVALGALQAIPRDLEDAADVDGAGRFQRFRLITFPLLRPALVPAVILGMVWTFNMFNIIWLVSEGGPDGSTEILITEAYRWAFGSRGERYGYAAAYGVLIFGVLLFWTWLTSRGAAREVANG
jgi:arabinogalactan oligomer/maltooligosaccharide transport system permease protein